MKGMVVGGGHVMDTCREGHSLCHRNDAFGMMVPEIVGTPTSSNLRQPLACSKHNNINILKKTTTQKSFPNYLLVSKEKGVKRTSFTRLSSKARATSTGETGVI